MNFQEFSSAVGKAVKEQYGLDDGDALCLPLYESGIVNTDDGVLETARIVAQYLQ